MGEGFLVGSSPVGRAFCLQQCTLSLLRFPGVGRVNYALLRTSILGF